MAKKQSIEHIIIQAGGQGTRMAWYTRNKPKALVSIGGEPMIFSLMKQHPEAKFYIRASYKAQVLVDYMAMYGGDFDYQIITTHEEGDAGGIKEVLKFLPDGVPFAVVWCDLYWNGRLYPEDINVAKKNYLGLSNTFPCRWSFTNGRLEEVPSDERGIAGVYIFKNKKVLTNLAEGGEFCRYLQTEKIPFARFVLKNVREVGTIDAYEETTKDLPVTRPFNRLVVEETSVTKIPVNDHGKELARREAAWYEVVRPSNFDFIPKMYKLSPLTLQKLSGDNLFKSQITETEKKKALTRHIDHLRKIHKVAIEVPAIDLAANDHKALLSKTKERLDSVASLIPFSQDPVISINGRPCPNPYMQWDKVEKMAAIYLGKSPYCFIHGDPTFSNTIHNPATNEVYMIDPRGYYGDVELAGDLDYDWAKLYYSIVGNYDQFNLKRFRLDLTDNKVELQINSSGWEGLEDYFFELTKADPAKVKFMHAIIWLSLASYAWDNYDSICGAFYNGVYLLGELK